jgi:hypothetical protein
MNITDAIKTFESQGHKTYPPSDVKKILEVVEEHGFSDFKITSQFITDVSDVLHIHPTMIVSGQTYADSTDRGPEPYKNWPHFFELSGMRDIGKSDKETIGTMQCPDFHNPFPVTSECECGWKPAKN